MPDMNAACSSNRCEAQNPAEPRGGTHRGSACSVQLGGHAGGPGTWHIQRVRPRYALLTCHGQQDNKQTDPGQHVA